MPRTPFKEYVEAHGYTAREIAETLGLSRHTILAYMQGVRTPNLKIIKKMQDKLEDFNIGIFM